MLITIEEKEDGYNFDNSIVFILLGARLDVSYPSDCQLKGQNLCFKLLCYK